MIAILSILAAAALLFAAPGLAARLFEKRAPSHTIAAFHLLVLFGAVVLPLVVLACIALLRPDHGHHGACGAALMNAARWLAVGLVALYVVRLAWAGASATRAIRRVSARAALAAGARPQRRAGGTVLVLPTAEPVAYAAGAWSGHVVVSRGLLNLLDQEEQEAAIAHELAHVRLRHHRLLLFANVVASALGSLLPPVRRALASLQRELEAIADRSAAQAVGGREVVVRALAKVALVGVKPVPAPALGNADDLAYRIARLEDRPPPEDRRAVAAGALGVLGLALVVVQCTALHPPSVAAGLAICIGIVIWLARRTRVRSLQSKQALADRTS